MVCKVGGQYEHVPVIPAYCFRVDGDCPYYFRIALTLSTYLKHLRIVCRQAVTVRRTHQFAGNRFYFCVVTLVVWALVQIEPDEEHIGKSLAESAVFGFCWGGQVASCKDQVFFYELYHFLFGKACQRLFHCGIFQYFQRSYDQWTEHVVQGIGNESAGTSYFRSVALFLLRAQEVACFNLCQRVRSAVVGKKLRSDTSFRKPDLQVRISVVRSFTTVTPRSLVEKSPSNQLERTE